MTIPRRRLPNFRASTRSTPRTSERIAKTRRGKCEAESSHAASVGRHLAPCTTSTELDRVQEAAGNDPNAQEQLFRLHASKLYRIAFAILRNKEDAEDAVQDSWLRAYNHLNCFQGRSSFSTWLTRIAINSALMILRKNRSSRMVSVEDLNETEKDSLDFCHSDTSPNPEEIYAQQERRLVLNVAIHGLTPRLRNVVELGRLKEFSVSETARGLEISTGTVKARLFRARVTLRKSPTLRAIAQAKRELAA